MKETDGMDAGSHGRETPMASRLGWKTLSVEPAQDTFSADRVPALSQAEGAGLSGGAMLAFIDHALGTRVVRVNRMRSTSTIEIRVEWTGELPSSGAVRAIARSHAPRNGVVFAHLILEGDGGPFARASGTFVAGALSNGADARLEPGPDDRRRSEDKDFRSFIGAEWRGERLVVPPSDHIVGVTEALAVHGGVIAGALHLAACDRATQWQVDHVPISMAMRFLRPATAQHDIQIACDAEQLGRRMATLRCTAWHIGRVVAVGEFIFWRDS